MFAFTQNVCSIEWPLMCLCVVRKLLILHNSTIG